MLVTIVSHARMAELIEVSFGCELRWAQGTMEPGSPQWKEQLLGGSIPLAHCKVQQISGVRLIKSFAI